MKLFDCAGYDEMSRMSAEVVYADILEYPTQLLCAATGNSPLGLYKILVEHSRNNRKAFSSLRLLKLDEWLGLPEGHEASCEAFLRKNLIAPLELSEDRYLGWGLIQAEAERECHQIDKRITARGGIGCCILGLGANGHIGFIEPADYLLPYSHVSRLSKASRAHGMVAGLPEKPELGVTLGMKTLLQSRKVVLLISGKGKADITNDFLQGRVSSRLPASFLWLHPNAYCFRDLNTTE